MKNHVQTRQPRMLSNDVHATAFADDAAAREKVYTLGLPRVILIKINSKNKLGLPEAEYVGDNSRKKDEHLKIAAHFGIDPDAFRDREGKVHTGAQTCTNESRVRLGQLLVDMKAAGYKYVGGRWRQKQAQQGRRKQPDPALEFTFSLVGEEVEMPEQIRTFLNDVYVDGFNHWSNPKLDEKDQVYRLDTLNGFAGQPPGAKNANAGRALRLDAKHYTGFNIG
ncbi:MAG: hypothetical protein QY323_03060 [Patescibacteria group bacterium]|nr:MAG: hypothetical protein QY323_03060 [Patescibacteria group bacterium]